MSIINYKVCIEAYRNSALRRSPLMTPFIFKIIMFRYYFHYFKSNRADFRAKANTHISAKIFHK